VSFYGFLATASGAGLTFGAALAAVFAQRVGVARTFWLSFLLSAILIVVYARLMSFVPAVIVLFLSGLFVGAVNVAVMPLVLQVTPKELIGRVAAVVTPVMTLASILSVAVAGWLVSGVLRGLHATLLGIVFGPIDTIFTVTGVLAVIGGLYAMVNLRNVKVQDE
jgi:MFS family permease